LSASGCSDDIFDVEADLTPEVYHADFGSTVGTIPIVSCDPASPGVCGGSPFVDVNAFAVGLPVYVQVSAGCATASARCFVQADARLSYTVDVFQDDQFTSKVARGAVTFVRIADLAYTVPSNTLTFDVPEIDIYVGPAGTTRETDPGVVFVGRTNALARGATLAAGHLSVDDSSPARATIESSIAGRQPFVFVLALAPRLDGGSAMPAGALEVDVSPHLLLGLPP
jgi:hypothetical protein